MSNLVVQLHKIYIFMEYLEFSVKMTKCNIIVILKYICLTLVSFFLNRCYSSIKIVFLK